MRVLAVDDEAAVTGRDRGEVDLGREARGRAEHHVAVARTFARVAGAIAIKCPDDEVVETVAIDVAGRGCRIAGGVARILAMDDESAVAGRDRGEVDLGREARGLAEHHVAVASTARVLPGPSPRVAPMIRSSKPSPLMSPADDTQMPEISAASWPWMTNAAVASRDRGEVDLRHKARRLTEHHVAVASTIPRVGGPTATECSDDEVVEAVAIDIAGPDTEWPD